jgi:hypothetical protein
MAYPIGFFEIQELFARRVSAVAGLTLEESLLRYTTYYKRIGAKDWKFAQDNLIWRTFVERIDQGESPAKVAFEMYRAVQKAEDGILRFGCMGYDCRETTIIMHFTNNQSSIYGPLSKHNQAERFAELKEMFEHIFRHHPQAQFVEGFSWLYNYEAYRRLFPPEYTAHMVLAEDMSVRVNSAWGQFIDSTGDMHRERVAAFQERVGTATTLNELLGAFPFRIYKPRAEIKVFYPFYGVEA